MIADPNDFVDADEPEGDTIIAENAGKAGAGGKTTQQAEEDYKRTSDSHFTSDADIIQNSTIGIKGGKTKVKNPTDTLPQIGSIQDSNQNEPLIDDTVGGIAKTAKEK